MSTQKLKQQGYLHQCQVLDRFCRACSMLQFNKRKLYTDPNSYNNYGGLFAMSVVSLLPVIIVFIVFQKYIVEGIATDGIKG